jgi:hypothetical protein
MSFHVEVGRSFHRARVFNLDEGELRATVLEPWSRGQTIELGEREWEPRENDLTVIEGPALDPADLAHGQGWNSATKSGQDVTARMLGATTAGGARTAVTVVAADAGLAAGLASLVSDLGLTPVEWAPLRARVLTRAPAALGVAAAVVLVSERGAFDAGLALGALGPRAVAVQIGGEQAGGALAAVPVIRLDAGVPALHALAERLRHAGGDVRPAPGWDAAARFAD